MQRVPGWSWRSRAPAATGSDWPAVSAAGLRVIEAHLAVLTALRLDAGRLHTPRADGDREALRILLGAREELTVANAAQTNRLRALSLGGDDGDDRDRNTARAPLTETVLRQLARRPPRPSPAANRPSGKPRSAGWPKRYIARQLYRTLTAAAATP